MGIPITKRQSATPRSQGKKVRAVIAGHMHRAIKGGGSRTWNLVQDETLYINAANVPRIRRSTDAERHHHIELQIGDDVTFQEHWVEFPTHA